MADEAASDQKIRLKTAEGLAAEYHAIVETRTPLVVARVNGALWGLNAHEQAFGAPPDTGVLWILRAHKGTLEKLANLLPAERVPSSLELLAAARNLFENLVWLKLFELDVAWGVHFYGQLLKNEIEDLTGLLAKVTSEMEFFRSLDAEDDAITEASYEGLGETDRPIEEEMSARRAQHDARMAELDRRARASFAIYATAATFNGYFYQAHLLETKEIPRVETHLAAIQKLLDAFETDVGDADLLKRYLGTWNWRGEALRVGMVTQYDFLYRLTSRLLHATPMNIITEKTLTESEQMLLLEYMVVGVSDAIDMIERFDFPGRVNIAVIETGQEDTPD